MRFNLRMVGHRRQRRRIGLAGLSLWLLSSIALAQNSGSDGLELVEAVNLTRQHDPTLEIQRAQVDQQIGNALAARGAFDWRLLAQATASRDHNPLSTLQRISYGNSIDAIINDASGFSISLDRTFRTGLTLSPRAQVSRSSIGIDGTFPGFIRPYDNLSFVSLTATQPLLRNRGLTGTAGVVQATEAAVDGARAELDHVTAVRILNTISAYWQYVRAWEQAAIIERLRDDVAELLDDTQRLVAADQRPAADLDQIQADAASRAAQHASAQQELFAARQELGRAIGLSADDSEQLGPPRDALPDSDDVALPPDFSVAPLLLLAEQQRQDLEAAHEQTRAARFLRDAARRNAKPRLDLQFTLGYNGLAEGRAFSQYLTPFSNVPGINVAASLIYAWPVQNRSGRGQVLQQEASYETQTLYEADLRRSLEIDLAVAVDRVVRSSETLTQSSEAKEHMATALHHENRKAQEGLSTLLNVTLMRDRLLNAEIAYLNAQVSFAVALAQLRFVTGTLDAEAPATLQHYLSLPEARP